MRCKSCDKLMSDIEIRQDLQSLNERGYMVGMCSSCDSKSFSKYSHTSDHEYTLGQYESPIEIG